MGIELNADFSAQFEALKTKEMERIGKKGELEVGVYFEKNLLSSLAFNQSTGPWKDNYWIIFPNPEKISWEEVKKALRSGFKYMSESSQLSSSELGMMD